MLYFFYGCVLPEVLIGKPTLKVARLLCAALGIAPALMLGL